MAEQFANKIKRLELENFTCFGKLAMDFSPGINVIIGENGTGKTHLLKVLYAAISINFTKFNKNRDTLIKSYNLEFNRNIKEVFKVDKNVQLVTNWGPRSTINIAGGDFEIALENSILSDDFYTYSDLPSHKLESLFIPVMEMLSWQKGFINIFERQENGFDKTYFDLAVALNGEVAKGALIEREVWIKTFLIH